MNAQAHDEAAAMMPGSFVTLTGSKTPQQSKRNLAATTMLQSL